MVMAIRAWFQAGCQMAPDSRVAGGLARRRESRNESKAAGSRESPPVAWASAASRAGSGERSSLSLGGAGTVTSVSGVGGESARGSINFSRQVPGWSGVKEARQSGRPEGSATAAGRMRAGGPAGPVTSMSGSGAGVEPR